MTNNLKEVEKLVEEWGCEHLSGKFMFEPMWLRAKQDMVALINQKEKELLERLEEIVGADDQKDIEDLDDDYGYCITCGVMPEPTEGKCDCDCRNELRSELRDRIKQLKEELKEKQL